MTSPVQYVPATDFSEDEADSLAGRSSVRTINLDAEFAAIRASINGTINNLNIIQRSDTALRDGVVSIPSLSAEVLALLDSTAFTVRGAWLTATAYVVGDIVTQAGTTYVGAVAHTSGTFATDLAAVKWVALISTATPTAASVTNVPAGAIAATDVQAALNELDTEKAPKASPTLTGTVTIPTVTAGDASTKAASTAFVQTALATLIGSMGKGIYGLTYQNAAGDVTNDIDIAAGGAMDSTGAYFMIGAASTKRLDAAWSSGTGNGGLDTGAIGNSEYHIWLIGRSDTGAIDYLFSLSATAPTMPASYDHKRLIGHFRRLGGVITIFNTYETEGGGLEFTWRAPTLDVDATVTTSRRTDAMKVPTSFSTIAHLNVAARDDTTVDNVRVECPDQTDAAVATNTGPMANIWTLGTATNQVSAQIRVRTSATGTIAARSNAGVVDVYRVSTIGFNWARRN